MAQVYLGLGSNRTPHEYLQNALNALQHLFGHCACSPVYESKAVGFEGENFLNMVVAINTSMPLAELSSTLKNIENQNGRDRSAPRFSGRTLDIDILTYDQLLGEFDHVQLPRDEIFKHAFVLKPLSDLAPDLVIPGTRTTARALWQTFELGDQALWQTAFTWQPPTD